jgi:hypothetical protein
MRQCATWGLAVIARHGENDTEPREKEMAGMTPAMAEILMFACRTYFSAATTGPRPISWARP